jgi:hypothetical protein
MNPIFKKISRMTTLPILCLALAGCDKGPSEADIKAAMEAATKAQVTALAGNNRQVAKMAESYLPKVAAVKKLSCNSAPDADAEFLCVVEITSSLNNAASQTAAGKLRLAKGSNGWRLMQ